ncbi:MAG: SDR family oxidoreductase [Acidimicrobiia bacterium]|nr:SDR family oxidoreductase [Acidimicrobiia bacterium]MDH3398073.1 SDR family oxidoreductase [Acidimicrobiia bacterium]
MNGLIGKRVLVTGGSRNLGGVIAERLARGGLSVAVNYHTSASAAQELVTRLEAESGRPHIAVGADMTRQSEVTDALAAATDGLGGTIDILVNNAGPFGMTPFVEMSETEWDTVWDANVKAVYLAVREVVPGMRAAGWGRVINISAVSAYVRNRSIYGLAKSAIVTLTEQLALELAPEVTVNAVAPGQILESLDDLGEFSTEWAEKVTARTPAGRLVTRAEVAELVYLLCTPAFDMITGVTIPVDGGLRLPRF